MLGSLKATMQTAVSLTAKLGMQPATASRHSVAHLHRAARLNKAVHARPMLRHISVMSYPQAYPEPAPAPRSSRVYTNFSVRPSVPESFTRSPCQQNHTVQGLSSSLTVPCPAGVQRFSCFELQGYQAKLGIQSRWCPSFERCRCSTARVCAGPARLWHSPWRTSV